MRPADLVLPEIHELLRESPNELAESLEDFHPVDVAEIYTRLDGEDGKIFINHLPIDLQTSVFEELDKAQRLHVIQTLSSGRAAKLIEWMSPDDRADFLQELNDETREALLATVDRNIVRDIRALLNYAPDTAGGIMTTEYLKVPESYTVDQCLAWVRTHAGEQEMIYTLYVIDEESGRLLGVMSLRDVLISKGDVRVGDIMTAQVLTVRYDTPQGEVAELISRYDLLAAPVVDNYGRLLGMVTVDDVIDVVREEQSESFQRVGAMQPIEESYFETSFFSLMRKRGSWLVTLFVAELVTGTALRHFEHAISGALALVFFVPLIVSSGGNSGSQSSTLVIRSLALGEITGKRISSLFMREALMGIALGTLLGLLGFIRALTWGNGVPLALTVALTLVAVVTIGTIVGSALPLLFRRLGFDPAVSSAPFISSLVDVFGIIAYFSLAKLILGV